MTYVIAVANEKGGVAKTTTTLSLGGALVETGNDVLLIDLDPQANLTLALGFNPARMHRSMTDVLMNSAALLSVSRETSLPGLDLIPANGSLGLAERFLPIRNNYETLLQRALGGHLFYDYVLIDCPPSLGSITVNALTAAELLIIPTQAEYFSAHALRNMMGLVRRIRASSNPKLTYRVLITMQDLRNRIHRIITNQLRATFGDGLLQTVIQLDTRLRESAVVGLPITHFAEQTRGAEQYRSLARELTQNVRRRTVAQPAQSLF